MVKYDGIHEADYDTVTSIPQFVNFKVRQFWRWTASAGHHMDRPLHKSSLM